MSRDRKIIEHYGVQEYATKADFPPASDPGPTTIYTRDTKAHYKTNGTEWIGEGYSDSIADRPSAAVLGKGTWQVGGVVYESDGVDYVDSIASNTKVVALVSDLATVPSTYTTAIVKDSLRWGVFNWSATGTVNTGTVFAGVTGFWVRQYSGGVDVKWFGAKGDNATIDTIAIQAALDHAFTIASYVTVPPGTYLVDDELWVRCSIKGADWKTTFIRSVITTSDITTKYKLQLASGKQVIAYEATTKAVLNADGAPSGTIIEHLRIGSLVFSNTDALVLTLPPVTGIRAGRINNATANPAFNACTINHVKIQGCHTAMDITGWLLNLTKIYIVSAKNGIVASEFNNVFGTIKMELVVNPLNVYDSTQVILESFINEGGLTWGSSYLDACRGFKINGVYMEGGVIGAAPFKIGTRAPVDVTLTQASIMRCYDVAILGADNVISSFTYPFVAADYVDGLTISGTPSFLNSVVMTTTENSLSINLEDISTTRTSNIKTNGSAKTYLTGSAPRQFLPNNTFKYSGDYGPSGYRTTKTNVTITKIVTSDADGVKPLTGESMLKVTGVNAGGITSFNTAIYLHNTEIKKYFNIGDTICAGAWVYVPSQTYDPSVSGNNPYFQLTAQSTVNGSQYALTSQMKIHNNWAFITATMTLTKADLDYIYFSFWLSNGVEKVDGTYLYVDSIYLTKGPGSMYYLKSQIFNKELSPFGVDTGSGMFYKFGAETLAEYDIYGSKGDRISNPNKATSGAFQYLECITDGDRALTAGLWKPVGIPPNIPTTNQGVGTIWANSGVLTLGA